MKRLYGPFLVVFFLLCSGFTVGTQSGIKVVPNFNLADQGNTIGRSVKNIVDATDPNRMITIVLAQISGFLDENTPYHFETNLTLPSNVTLEIESGAYIDGSAILTINGPFEAGLTKCFAPDFDVVFSGGNCETYHLEWWNFTSSNIAADNGIAFQACLNSIPAGGKVSVSPGIYSCSRVDVSYNYTYINLVGVELNPNNQTQDHQLVFDNVDYCKLSGGYFNGGVSGSNILIDTNDGDLRNLNIENIRITGGAETGTGTSGHGIHIDVSDNDVSSLDIRDVFITNTNHGIYIESSGYSNWAVDHSTFDNIKTWPYGADPNTPGHGIKVEGAIDSTFRRIYAGLFEHDGASAIYINPKYPTGMRNNVFEIVTCDVISKTNCHAIYVIVPDITKPCYSNIFSNLKVYNVSGAIGNIPLRIYAQPGTFYNNFVNCVWSNHMNHSDNSHTIHLNAGCYNNTISMCGMDPNAVLSDFILDYGNGNIILGRSYNGIFYPDYSASDQGLQTKPNTIRYAVDKIGNNNGKIVLRHVPLEFDTNNYATTYYFETDETIPSNITLKIEPGAYIDGNATLTIDGLFEAGLTKCFGPNFDVVFGPGSLPDGKVHPEWFGADESGDDYSAIYAALAAICRSDYGKLSINRMYDIGTTILIDTNNLMGKGTCLNDEDVSPLNIIGLYPPAVDASYGNSNDNIEMCGFHWIGDPNTDMMIIRGWSFADIRTLNIKNLYFDGNYVAENGLYLHQRINRGAILSNLMIKFCNGYGLKMGEDDTDEDSLWTIRFNKVNCVWNGYGMRIKGIDNTFNNCVLEYNEGAGLYYTGRNTQNRFLNGTIQFNTSPQVIIDTLGDGFLFQGNYLEGQTNIGITPKDPNLYEQNAEFIKFPGIISATALSIKLKDNRFIVAISDPNSDLAEDYVVRNFATLYGFEMSSNVFSGSGSGGITMFADANSGSVSTVGGSVYFNNYFTGGANHQDFDSNSTQDEFAFVNTKTETTLPNLNLTLTAPMVLTDVTANSSGFRMDNTGDNQILDLFYSSGGDAVIEGALNNNLILKTEANEATEGILFADPNLTTIGKIDKDGDLTIARTFNYGSDTASDDDYIVSLDSLITGYAKGAHYYFDANNPNTGACTANFNSIGARSIKIKHDNDPNDNCIEAGMMVDLMYDGTNFQMMNLCAN